MKNNKIVAFAILIISAISVSGQDFEIKPLSVNKPNSSDIAPFYSDSTLYFCSNRRSSLFKSYLNQNMDHLYRWYSSKQGADGKFAKPILFQPNLQSKLNNGPFILVNNGNTIVSSQNSPVKSSKNVASIQINVLNLNNNDTNSAPLTLNSSQFQSYGQPSMSADGRFLYFSAITNNGFGLADIYVCENNHGQWGTPVNLGKTINTPGNEVFPFIHASGMLYFASENHGSVGGLDLFYTFQKNGEWVQPIALPEPINTIADDYAIYLDDEGVNGFLTSNREKNDNIYQFVKTWPQFEICNAQVEDNFCFTLFEDGPFQSDTLPIAYRWDFGDGKTAKGKEVDHCFPGPGSYHVTLNAVDTLNMVDLLTVADYWLDLEQTQQVVITAPLTIKVGQKANFDAIQTYLKDFNPENYFWDFGDGNRAKGIKVEHTYMSSGSFIVKCGTISESNPTIKHCSYIEITVID